MTAGGEARARGPHHPDHHARCSVVRCCGGRGRPRGSRRLACGGRNTLPLHSVSLTGALPLGTASSGPPWFLVDHHCQRQRIHFMPANSPFALCRGREGRGLIFDSSSTRSDQRPARRARRSFSQQRCGGRWFSCRRAGVWRFVSRRYRGAPLARRKPGARCLFEGYAGAWRGALLEARGRVPKIRQVKPGRGCGQSRRRWLVRILWPSL
jgi:hypothetical protein